MTGVATVGELSTYVLAHGIGDRQDLPLPFGYVLAGAGAALVVSFLALGLLWRTPRLGRSGAGVPVPADVARVLDSTAFAVALRLLGLLATAYVGVAAVLGPDNALNPTAGAVYVQLWVGVPLASVLLGPLWRALNPLRTVHAGLALLLRTSGERLTTFGVVTTLVATTRGEDDVMRHGTPIGFFVPVDAKDRAAGRAALGRLGEAVSDVLERTGMTEDHLVDELSMAREHPS